MCVTFLWTATVCRMSGWKFRGWMKFLLQVKVLFVEEEFAWRKHCTDLRSEFNLIFSTLSNIKVTSSSNVSALKGDSNNPFIYFNSFKTVKFDMSACKEFINYSYVHITSYTISPFFNSVITFSVELTRCNYALISLRKSFYSRYSEEHNLDKNETQVQKSPSIYKRIAKKVIT